MYKTILVHVDGGAGQESRLSAAALLCKEHGAHLVGCAATGITWRDYALLSSPIGATDPEPGADYKSLRKTAAAALQQFEHQAARLGVGSLETRMVEDDARNALLLESRYADLVVLGQEGQNGQGERDGKPPAHARRQRRLPEFLALRGVRPVLVVPRDYAGAPIPGVALAGWDGSLQSARAIQAALPLLQSASEVKLVLVNPDSLSELPGQEPGADMARHLARQQVAVQVVVERTRATVGAALMGLARDCGAGLMVCGAYGHSRYREWILGGATRELFERVRLPLLIAH